MQAETKDIQSAALAMDPTHRARLAARLIGSLEAREKETIDDHAIEKLWLEEVQRRVERLDAGLEKTIPAEQVLEELRNRLR